MHTGEITEIWNACVRQNPVYLTKETLALDRTIYQIYSSCLYFLCQLMYDDLTRIPFCQSTKKHKPTSWLGGIERRAIKIPRNTIGGDMQLFFFWLRYMSTESSWLRHIQYGCKISQHTCPSRVNICNSWSNRRSGHIHTSHIWLRILCWCIC